MLKTLNIYINKLKDIDINWEGLSSLESLDVGHNWLKNLPPSFSALKAVSQLNLSGNDLTALPKCVRSLHFYRSFRFAMCDAVEVQLLTLSSPSFVVCVSL